MTFILPGIAPRPVGGYKVVYQYANDLVARNHAVSVIHMRMSHLKPTSYRHRAVTETRYALQRRYRPAWARLAPEVQVRNFAVADEHHVPVSDVVVATSVGTADLVHRLTGPRTRGVYLIQHFEDFTMPPDAVLETWRYPLTRVVVSGWLKSIADKHGLPATLVENGVDTDHFIPGRAIDSRPRSVLAMVSDQAFKRTDLIVDAFKAIATDEPTTQLQTFGACPRPAGLHPNVSHFQNPEPRALRQLYQEAQVFVCASDWEGFGLPALEAMACGAAVVSTDNGGVPSFAGDAAVIVRRGNARAIGEATTALLNSRQKLSDVAAKGLSRAEDLSLRSAADRFEAVLFGS
ncbi:MAG: glycosyltransferase family 4 protein [Fimbriimonadaceae bacterium]|nr:glycosyltransferase family 4 protein [Fimbriimonadaceae bacterium]